MGKKGLNFDGVQHSRELRAWASHPRYTLAPSTSATRPRQTQTPNKCTPYLRTISTQIEINS